MHVYQLLIISPRFFEVASGLRKPDGWKLFLREVDCFIGVPEYGYNAGDSAIEELPWVLVRFRRSTLIWLRPEDTDRLEIRKVLEWTDQYSRILEMPRRRGIQG